MPYVSSAPNNFRTPLAQSIFAKYAIAPEETWLQRCTVVVDDVCGTVGGTQHPLMSKEDRRDLVHFMHQFMFMPGGRYLYYGGRGAKFYNNCLSRETNVLTDEGWANVADSVGKTLNVLSPVDGKYYPAEFHAHGEQVLNTITFSAIRGRSRHRWVVRATGNHRWYLSDGTVTENLQVGDLVPANAFSSTPAADPLGFAHGFVYGDGVSGGTVRLCGAKRDLLDRLLEVPGATVTYPASSDGDPHVRFKADVSWKNLPRTESARYIASFIEGWIAADGSHNGNGRLIVNSVDRSALEWLAENAPIAGYVATGRLRSQVRDVRLRGYAYDAHEIFILNLQRGDSFAGFKVESIEVGGVEEVFCPFEPVHNQIVIDGGIHTGQCYLFKSQEDTREEWGRLLHNASDALMSGGGIGNDYTVFRERGALLRRTGGTASGPIPLAMSVNNHGRNVKQGGSRRSAIYASLNWRHGDAPEWLRIKDWANMLIPGTTTTYAQAKTANFDAEAPLDFTNISLNYDNAWLVALLSGIELDDEAPEDLEDLVNDFDLWSTVVDNTVLPSTFADNIAMAMRNGEPGFSFNFFAKEQETGRNACTEVTSADDGDVCNLGSLNMAAIPDRDTWKRIVELGAKFLVCGTLRADLPNDQIRRVREKNRRLGLGLMGVHEWLLQRGYRYEMTDELRSWMEIYEDESERAANEHCDRFYINRPVAYRAVAPTGTIGTLAGTTTGIEPIYAVAYKRRYIDGNRLTGAETRKFQYYIDQQARELIETYGLDPEEVESASQLAIEPERRVRFQADVQDYVDMAISSTLNLPAWDTEYNNAGRVDEFARVVAKYAPRLRGLTFYPDGARGGQPLVPVSYEEALAGLGTIYEENSDKACASGVCGI